MPTIDATVMVNAYDHLSTHRAALGQYTGPASYATGGDSLVPSDLKSLGKLDLLLFEPAINAGASFYNLIYDHTNEKVIWLNPATGAEVANATDLSGFSARYLALGQ